MPTPPDLSPPLTQPITLTRGPRSFIGALGRKVSDEFTVPLCRLHHRELHRARNEAGWWAKLGIDASGPLGPSGKGPAPIPFWGHPTRPGQVLRD